MSGATWWKGCLLVEGEPTQDGRAIALYATTWRTGMSGRPLPVLQPATDATPPRITGSILLVQRTDAPPTDAGERRRLVLGYGRWSGPGEPGDRLGIGADIRIDVLGERRRRFDQPVVVQRGELLAATVTDTPVWPHARIELCTERPWLSTITLPVEDYLDWVRP